MVHKTQKSIIKVSPGGISLDQLLPNAGGSIFSLARLAMLRALQINAGSRPLVDFGPLDKETSIALREIAQGEVVLGPVLASRVKENLS